LDEGNIGALMNAAHQDQWRELIVLAAGLAGQRVREEIIIGLIKRGDDEPQHRHQLHLLAVACLETSVALNQTVLQEVKDRLKSLVPPSNISEGLALASAGELAVPYLRSPKKLYVRQAAASVRALAAIGGETALAALEDYAEDPRDTVVVQLLRAWQFFDAIEFARRILKRRRGIVAKRFRSLENFSLLDNFQYLHFHESNVIDLKPISRLPKLTHLSFTNCAFATDLSSLATLPKLIWLRLTNCYGLRSMASIAKLKKLRKIELQQPSLEGLEELTSLPCLEELYIHSVKPDAINLPAKLRSITRFLRDIELCWKLGGIGVKSKPLTQSFDELRPPANLAPRVTFDVIYPAVPTQSRAHPHHFFSFFAFSTASSTIFWFIFLIFPFPMIAAPVAETNVSSPGFQTNTPLGVCR
jgi:hypothetical protein